MRVLVSTGIFPNRSDTTRGVYVYQQVAALARRDEVRVVAPVPFIPRGLTSRRYRPFADVPRRDTLSGIDVRYPRYVVIPRVLRFLHGYFVYACTLPAHARAVRAGRPQVVVSFFAYPYGFAAVLVARTFGLPVVVSCRGSDINHLAKPFLHRRLIAWSLRRCRAVLAVSRALSDEIAALGVERARIHVVPNGIDATRFRGEDRTQARRALGLDPAGPLAVCVSRLSREKGIDLLVDAIARCERRDLRCVVVGDGPEAPALSAQRDRLGLGSRVQLVGRRPHDEVPRWMSAADVVVLASRSEGHPNALVEALACGRPVVAPRVGGVPDVVTSPALGVVVEAEDPDALARGLEAALSQTWDENRLAATACLRSWEHVAGELHEILAAAAGESSPAPAGLAGAGGARGGR
jgi:glycosyltransferase involved in cell wall biosynthesis